LPTRRCQAALGITSARAALDKAEREVAYAVTRTWFTVVFAREQERVARGVVDRLSAVRDTAQRMLKEGARDVSAADVNRTVVYAGGAQPRQVEGEQGVKRGLALLREAIGLGPDCAVQVPAGRLPDPKARPTREAVLAAVLTRRGELVIASTYAEVAGL